MSDGEGDAERSVAERARIVGQHADRVETAHGEVVARTTAEQAPGLLARLREDARLGLAELVDLTAVDRPDRSPRFEIVYQLRAPESGERVRVRAALPDGAAMPSVTPLHAPAEWLEREVFDLFGIVFDGHPDLRRILRDDAARGHPLRKDEPRDAPTVEAFAPELAP